MTAVVIRFLRDCSGTTAIEYAVIGSVISIAIVAGAVALGSRLNGVFASIAGQFN